jgi:hypothetical protein
VLKLKKSLYGLKQSPRNHFTNLSNKLKTLGFESCDADPCLFASNSCIFFVYVDDTLLFARSQGEIEAVVQGLKNLGMNLEEEDDVAGFLGVLIQRHSGTNRTLQKKICSPNLSLLMPLSEIAVNRVVGKTSRSRGSIRGLYRLSHL